MKQEIFHVFDDNIISEFCISTAKRRMELYLEYYWDIEKKENIYVPCCFKIWGWEEATWIEKSANHVSSILPLTDNISPLTDIFDMDITDGLLTIEAMQENYMFPTLYFKNCSFSFEHVDMTHHVNVFQFTVPDSILKRDCADFVIPSVHSVDELLIRFDKILRIPRHYKLTWDNLEEQLYGRDFSRCDVLLLHHEDISHMPYSDTRLYADLIKRCNRNNNHCYFIFNEHDYQLMMRLINNSHD
jgi:hypothetical protein